MSQLFPCTWDIIMHNNIIHCANVFWQPVDRAPRMASSQVLSLPAFQCCSQRKQCATLKYWEWECASEQGYSQVYYFCLVFLSQKRTNKRTNTIVIFLSNLPAQTILFALLFYALLYVEM